MIHLTCTPKREQNEKIQSEAKTEAPELKGGSVFGRVTKNNSLYSCYIPSSYSEGRKYPVFIFLDPHAKGNLPVEKYKSLAEKFQFMLVGSGSTKNGMDLNLCSQIVNDLVNESVAELPGQAGRITLIGFSGGAKIALAGSTGINGLNSVVYCGAAFPPGSIKISTPCMGIAGSADMNYTEVRNFNFSLSVKGTYHTLVEWKGKHEWPDSSAIAHAFYWNIFNSIREKKIENNDSVLSVFRKTFDNLIESEKNLLVKSELMLEEIEMLKNVAPVEELKTELKELNNSTAFKNAKKSFDNILAAEDERKKELIASFENKDLQWWRMQIEKLNSDTNNTGNKRLLGYISLASWSYSTKAISSNENNFALKALNIYKLADPKNSEQPYLLACLFAKNNMPDSAVFYINESVSLGFDDRNRTENEKDLFALHGRSDFQEALGKMR